MLCSTALNSLLYLTLSQYLARSLASSSDQDPQTLLADRYTEDRLIAGRLARLTADRHTAKKIIRADRKTGVMLTLN